MNFSEMADALYAVGGVSAGAVITGLFTRRKHRVDALEKLEGIATRLAENAVAGAERRVSEVEKKMTALERDYADRDKRRQIAAAQHAAWDIQVATSLHELGVVVAPPPPLEDI